LLHQFIIAQDINYEKFPSKIFLDLIFDYYALANEGMIAS